ncbi:ganglioside-induced differentiation-associated protein 1 [Anopheles ziemanni]|uniref:ganglioside-induced differentiation-associated protein 1 n=1 Tax=Anopheles coustani TaxID=139045 RepID=UPI00265954D6|nr:ganglioside-induced differentiation-associated protein 1 [Anopheles coustani]XP_058166565.1 ganglioside-induced differentiation-associated protein 1 [Anopheles ziemanni]
MSDKSFKRPSIANRDGLVLYCNQYSYFCHKVLQALHVKGIPFEKYEIDVTNDEHFSEWFLELNPRAELPVLQNGLLIVPGSSRILDYLEENFPKSKSLRMPNDADKQVLGFRKTIESLPIGVLTIGSFLHPQHTGSPKFPFILPVRQTIIARESTLADRLRTYAANYPAFGEGLSKKADFHERKRGIIASEEYFCKLLEALDEFLNNVEQYLATIDDNEQKWLCGTEVFTIVDICLGTLLYRLYVLGLEDRFWGADRKRPQLVRYFAKVCQQPSFQDVLPSKVSILRTVWINMPPVYKAGLAAVSSVLISSTLLKR